jgi:hypothetical protein
MKDVDFDNLKALVEYMYKGEANVSQHMLQSFIRYLLHLPSFGFREDKCHGAITKIVSRSLICFVNTNQN